MNANAVFHALKAVRKSVERPATSINIARTLRDFAGQDDFKMRKIGLIAGKISGAAYGGTAYVQDLDAGDIALLRGLLEHAEADLALAEFTVPDNAVDQQHSPDESHYLDREKL